MTSVRVPNFSPTTAGLHFTNYFPHEPIREFRLGNIATLSIGDAANGLCGGMSFTVADMLAAGDPRYDYIVNRQIDSFENGALPLRIYRLMSPGRPDRESTWSQLLGRFGIDRHSRTWVMVAEEWPKVRADLDGGHLAPLAFVRVVSADPFRLTSNHQVLAWGYDLEGASLVLRIYDPNWPNDDSVTLSLDVGDPMGQVSPVYSKQDEPVVCFFRAPYQAHDPAAWRSG
jgi:hypothetical protein